MDDWEYLDRDDFEDDVVEAVDSCEECGCNIYEDEWDGSGLCDRCLWYIENSGRRRD